MRKYTLQTLHIKHASLWRGAMHRSAYLVMIVTIVMIIQRVIGGKIIDRVRLNGNDNNSIVAHRSYDDESLMVLSFNLESLVHADEQSSYQLGIAAFRQAYYFFCQVMWSNDFVSIFIQHDHFIQRKNSFTNYDIECDLPGLLTQTKGRNSSQ